MSVYHNRGIAKRLITNKQHTTPDLLAKDKKCQNVVVRLLLLSFENLAIFGQSKTKRFYKYVLPSMLDVTKVVRFPIMGI